MTTDSMAVTIWATVTNTTWLLTRRVATLPTADAEGYHEAGPRRAKRVSVHVSEKASQCLAGDLERVSALVSLDRDG